MNPLASLGQTAPTVPPNGEVKRQLTFIEKIMFAGVLLNAVSLTIHLWEMRRREALLKKELARGR